MKYSYNWLQKHITEPLPQPKDLAHTIIFHAFEVESMEDAANGGDTILDIKVLPDRSGDCLSHRGMAREIAGLLNLTLAPHTIDMLPQVASLDVHVTSEVCTRYLGVCIEGVQNSASPAWLSEALASLGQKSISTLVDITNYLLLDTGQPLHVFDADLVSGAIVVRFAHEGEVITTLSGEEKILTTSMLVIADQEKVLAIAGIKGGVAAQVTENTTRIILEAAHFDGVAIRTTSRALKIMTDASRRFENNVSSELIGYVVPQALAMIRELCGGVVTSLSDTYPKPLTQRSIVFTVHEIAHLLGDWVHRIIISEILDRYNYHYTVSENVFTLMIPFWRADIIGPHDIAEEIGRVHGYERIEAKQLPTSFVVANDPLANAISAIRARLLKQGYSEVYNYSFCKKGFNMVAHGIVGKSALRTNLTDGLQDSAKRNSAQAAILSPRNNPKKIFEIGSIFTEDGEKMMVATYTDGIIEEMSVEAYVMMYGIDTTTAAALPIADTNATRFVPWSNYPFIVRDVAVWQDGKAEQLADIVDVFAANYCAVPAVLFDSFTKDGKTSVAYRFVFQSKEKTLTDAEVDSNLALLYVSLSEQGFVVR